MFRRDWFRIVDALPAGSEHGIRWVRHWDFAATEASTGNDPDWAVGTRLGLRPDGTYIVADVRRTRATPHDVERLVRHTAELDGRGVQIWLEQEPGSAGKIVIDHYQRTVLNGWPVRGRPESGSKVVRADPVSAQAEAGNVSVLRAAWNEAWFSELEQFPQGAHDDQVDSFSGAFHDLHQAGAVQTVQYADSAAGAPVRRRGDLILEGEQYVDQP
jgi:predicted phage terminase large subunit-like protein